MVGQGKKNLPLGQEMFIIEKSGILKWPKAILAHRNKRRKTFALPCMSFYTSLVY